MTVVHRFWSGDEPTPLGQWGARAVCSVEPEARLADWTDATLPAWARLDHDDPRARSNFARFALLARTGGLWLDHDVIPLRRLTGAPGPWVAGLGGHPEATVAWFPSAGHPLAIEAAEAVAADPSRTARRHLAALIGHHRGVALEARVLPHDALGRRAAPPTEVWAVHLWATSRRRYERNPR